MKNFKGRGSAATSSRRPAGRPSFKRTFSASGASTLHDATCASCGKTCQVPFMPNGRKPVYCRECFIPKGDAGERSERPSRGTPDRSKGKPDFAPRRPYPQAAERTQSGDPIARQLSDISAKLDKLMRILDSRSH